MIQELNNIKEALFDAPAEVKSAFNEIVSYFSDNKDYKTWTHIGQGHYKKSFGNSYCVISQKVLDLLQSGKLGMKEFNEAIHSRNITIKSKETK